ncbi:MAG TPA: hypothetical protein VIY48_10400, partial [Candidatus Paceibacterota bacterium]
MKTIISFLVAMAMSASILPNKIFSNQSPPQQDLRSCGVTVYITLSTSLDPTGTIVTFNGII